uniref:Uncharacterized protein n=1 Tax=Ditylenchus dipsaci TaxID=166011 RepID=A0A915CN25_9BILA
MDAMKYWTSLLNSIIDAVSSSEFFIRKVIVEQGKGSHEHVPVSQPKLLDKHKGLMKGESNLTALIMQEKIQLKAYAEANSRVPKRRP